MNFTLKKKILIGFIACALVLVGVAIIAFNNSEKFIRSNVSINHNYQVISEFQQILVAYIDAETGTRGFVITGYENYLKTFSDDIANGFNHLKQAKELTKDNPSQQINIEDLEKLMNIRSNSLNRIIGLRTINFEQSRKLIASGEGKQIADSIRITIEKAQAIEQSLIIERKQASHYGIKTFNLVFGSLLLLILLILIMVYGIVSSNLQALNKAETETVLNNWLLTGNTKLSQNLIGVQRIEELANNAISFLCTYLNASIGAIYIRVEKNNSLVLTGQYAFLSLADIKTKIAFNEGLIGQVAHEQKTIYLTDIPDEHIRITSSVLHAKPKHLIIAPILFEGVTLGVIEIGSLTGFSKTQTEFINVSLDIIGISINSAIDRKQILELLEETQVQSNEKEKRASELIVANKELAFQNEEKEKRASELIVANKELAFQNNEKENRASELILANKELAYQNEEKEKRASELIIANKELAFQFNEKENRAAELIVANNELAYQNEEKEKRAAELVIMNGELASQSEELQTQQEELKQTNEELEEQAQNLIQQHEELQMANEELEEQTQSLEEKNKEVEVAKSDIELKTKQLEISSRYKSEFLANMSHELRTPLNSLLILSKDLSENRKKNLDSVQVECAEIIYKSGHDLLQLINEVLDLSKIEAGKMTLNIAPLNLKAFTDNIILNFKRPAEQKGLLLTCKLEKELPENIQTDAQRLNQIAKNLLSNALKFTETGSVNISIERHTVNTLIISVTDTGIGIPEDKQMAIFEAFQQVEGGTSRKYGGTGLGLSISRELARLLGAEIRVISKINEGSTFSVIIPLEIYPEQNAEKPSLAKIPAILEPGFDVNPKYLNYPSIADDRNTITNTDKIVLIIDNDQKISSILLELVNKTGVKCLTAASGEDGLNLAANYNPHTIILDLSLPDMTGLEFIHKLKKIKSHDFPPIIVYTGKELTKTENDVLQEYTKSIIIKGAKSEERLIDETALSLHRTISNAPKSQQHAKSKLYNKEALLRSKKILLVDDDMRNVFALSKILNERGMEIIKAENGKNALEMLHIHNDIDLVLMDIMMPVMDGYDAMKQIRLQRKLKRLPIIALTAKAMKDDKQKCIDAGANDYITKPIDVDRLLSLMRVWLSN